MLAMWPKIEGKKRQNIEGKKKRERENVNIYPRSRVGILIQFYLISKTQSF